MKRGEGDSPRALAHLGHDLDFTFQRPVHRAFVGYCHQAVALIVG